MTPTASNPLTARYASALAYAAFVHATQVRKGTSIPYLSHLLAVSSLVLEAGGDEDLAIAALLHDAAEDQGGAARLVDIHERFGARVAEVVERCSDSLAADPATKPPWTVRKARYIAEVRASQDAGYLLVTTADKLHNARAILADLRVQGRRLWTRFLGEDEAGAEKTVAQIIGYYAALAEALGRKPGAHGPMARELLVTVQRIEAEAGVGRDVGFVEGE